MALAAPIISVQDGASGVAANVANNATAFVTPGNVVTFALQSSSGVLRAEAVIQAPGDTLDGYRFPVVYASPFSWSILLPPRPLQFTISVEVTDYNNISTAQNLIVSTVKAQGFGVHRARNILATNVASLAAYTVAAAALNDNVAGGNVQGDYVLAVNQTVPAQNGLYVVGVVNAGVAPLTRVPDFATGQVLQAGQTCEVDAGTIFANSTWKVMTAGPITVDTTSHAWYPRMQTGTATSGAAFTTGWVFSAATPIVYAQKTGAATATTIGVITPGVPATSTFTITGAGTYAIAILNW